jgi:hypothetical protein
VLTTNRIGIRALILSLLSGVLIVIALMPIENHAVRGQTRAFTVQGERIIDPDGREFVARGVNIAGPNWVWDRSPLDDADAIANIWKFNTVRVNTCILTPHDRTGGYFSGGALRRLRMWFRDAAQKYKDNPYVWFDVSNEPGNTSTPDREQWLAMYQGVLASIREEGQASNIVLISDTNFGQGGTTAQTSALLAQFPAALTGADGKQFSNLVLTAHVYSNWRDDPNAIANYLDQVLATNRLPLIIGEYGIATPAGDTSKATQYLFDALQARAKDGKTAIGRIVWQWDGGDTNNLVVGSRWGSGADINDAVNPTNLSWLGLQVWRDNGNTTGAMFSFSKPSGSILNAADWSVQTTVEASVESPALMLDGDPYTRWTTGEAQRDLQSVLLDMKRSQRFNKIVLDSTVSPDDFPVEIEVQVSQDNRQWTSVPIQIRPGAVSEITFAPTDARYVLITQRGVAPVKWWSIHELYIVNDPQQQPDALVTPRPRPTPTPNPAQIVDASGALIIDDSVEGAETGQFNYVGTWKHCARCDKATYNNSNSWTFTPDDYAAFTFEGTQIEYYSVLDGHHGIVAVKIDDGAEVLVDLYGATRREDALVYTSPVLPYGTHRLTIRSTGQKNAASTGIVAAVDRVRILTK